MTLATRRLLGALAALLGPLALLGATAPGQHVRDLDLDRVPRALAGLGLVRSEALEPEVLEMVRPRSYVMRLYAADDAAVWLYAGYYDDGRRAAVHDPTVCYPAQGWEILSARMEPLDLGGGERLQARWLLVERDGRREVVLYWFQRAHRWALEPWREELMQVVDAVRGRPGFTFVRVSMPALDAGADDSSLRAVARRAAHEIRGLMSAAESSPGGAQGRAGAGDGTRTRDLHVGNVELYH